MGTSDAFDLNGDVLNGDENDSFRLDDGTTISAANYRALLGFGPNHVEYDEQVRGNATMPPEAHTSGNDIDHADSGAQSVAKAAQTIFNAPLSGAVFHRVQSHDSGYVTHEQSSPTAPHFEQRNTGSMSPKRRIEEDGKVSEFSPPKRRRSNGNTSSLAANVATVPNTNNLNQVPHPVSCPSPKRKSPDDDTQSGFQPQKRQKSASPLPESTHNEPILMAHNNSGNHDTFELNEQLISDYMDSINANDLNFDFLAQNQQEQPEAHVDKQHPEQTAGNDSSQQFQLPSVEQQPDSCLPVVHNDLQASIGADLEDIGLDPNATDGLESNLYGLDDTDFSNFEDFDFDGFGY